MAAKNASFARFMLLVLVGTLGMSSLAQKNSFVSSEYNRNAVTVLLLNNNERFSEQLVMAMDSITIPDKFFDNTLKKTTVPFSVNRAKILETDPVLQLAPKSAVEASLKSEGIGREIIAKWFDRQGDGSFGVKTLAERGVYNATDNDMLVASASKRGVSGLMDMGMSLVDRSYVILIDVPELLTLAEIYKRDSVPPAKQISNGFQGVMNVYVYKLDFSDAVATNFFENLWISEASVNKQERKTKFDNTDFVFKFVAVSNAPAMVTQLNPDQKFAPKQKSPQQLLKTFLDMGVSQAILRLEKSDASFKVKAMIADVNPIAIKIGRKEGLKFDQRYFVYENLQNRKGEVYSKRRGVIRAKSVTNNLKATEGKTQPSYFYQVAGRKLDNLGMFVEQANTSGFNLYAGITDGGLGGPTGRLEVLISPILYEVFVREGRISRMTGLKLYVEAAYQSQEFSNPIGSGKFGLLRYGAGLNKEMRLTRNIFLEPRLGYGFEDATFSDTPEKKVESQFVDLGVGLGLNLKYNLQLMPSLNLFSIITSKYTSAEGADPLKITYNDWFPGRSGMGFGLGLRFMF